MIDQKSDIKNQKHNLKTKNNFKERCFKYSLGIIRFTETLSEKRTYRIITEQLLRSSTSIGANFVEAKAASSKRDYIKYFEIALKSANESLYWLELLRELLTVDKAEINMLLLETQEIANIIGASLLTMKRKNI